MDGGRTVSGSGRKPSSLLSKPLNRLPSIFVKDCGYVPLVLTNAASIIEKHIKTKDIFQTQGTTTKANTILTYLNSGRSFRSKPPNVHDVIEAVKLFLIRLPSPLLPENVCDALILASKSDAGCKAYEDILVEYKQSCPKNVAILHFMLRLLKKVAAYSPHNLVDTQKLATIFVLDVIKPLKLGDPGGAEFLAERMKRLPYLIIVIESLIANLDLLSLSGPEHPRTLQESPSALSATTASMVKLLLTSASCTANERPAGEPHSLQTMAPHTTPSGFKLLEKDQGDTQDTTKIGDPKEAAKGAEVAEKIKGLPWASEMKKAEHGKSCERKQQKNSKPNKSKVIYGPTASSKRGTKTKKTVDGGLSKGSPARRRQSLSPDKKVKAKVNINWRQPNPEERRSISQDGKDACRQRAHQGGKRRSRTSSACKKSHCKKDMHKAGLSASHLSQFSTFRPDEEITPWKDAAANSDDPSLMLKTIKNPRVLSSFPSQELKMTLINPYVPYQPLGDVNFGFTISGTMKQSGVTSFIQAASRQAADTVPLALPAKRLSSASLSGMSTETSVMSIISATKHEEPTNQSWTVCQCQTMPVETSPLRPNLQTPDDASKSPKTSRKKYLEGAKHSSKSRKPNVVETDRPVTSQVATIDEGGGSMEEKKKVRSPRWRFRRPGSRHLKPSPRVQIQNQSPQTQAQQPYQKQMAQQPSSNSTSNPVTGRSKCDSTSLDYSNALSKNDETFKQLQWKFKQQERQAYLSEKARQNRQRDLNTLFSDMVILVGMLCCFIGFIYISVVRNSSFGL